MTHEIVDLRSDTVTKPTAEMKRAMIEAPLGDDVLGDEPTVIRLQEKVADLLGKEAACFVPSGTMANQTAIRAHTEPGDEIITHAWNHIYLYEGGAPMALSGCSIAFAHGPRGIFDASEMESLVRARNDHFPRSKLVVVENTHNRGGGAIWPLDVLKRLTDRARELGLRRHLDGARLWNAHIASGVSLREYARCFDTVSVCFSKGLGTPAGSAVTGDRDTIARVFRWRKMFGGAMRQSGVLAGAAIYALDHHLARLEQDHTNAAMLARGLAEIPGIQIDPAAVETNIVYFDVEPSVMSALTFCEKLGARGIRVLSTGPKTVRAVTHLDVNRDGIECAIDAVSDVCSHQRT